MGGHTGGLVPGLALGLAPGLTPGLTPGRAQKTTSGGGPRAGDEPIETASRDAITSDVGISTTVRVADVGEIPRSLGKALRIVDLRPKT